MFSIKNRTRELHDLMACQLAAFARTFTASAVIAFALVWHDRLGNVSIDHGNVVSGTSQLGVNCGIRTQLLRSQIPVCHAPVSGHASTDAHNGSHQKWTSISSQSSSRRSNMHAFVRRNRNVDIGRADGYVRYTVGTARCGPIPTQQRRRLS